MSREVLCSPEPEHPRWPPLCRTSPHLATPRRRRSSSERWILVVVVAQPPLQPSAQDAILTYGYTPESSFSDNFALDRSAPEDSDKRM